MVELGRYIFVAQHDCVV
uniref:Uncharacterized protein n=1 Tax=Arundo donax TaxID=35708 RepID=A0A0A8ZIK1_ARUDO